MGLNDDDDMKRYNDLLQPGVVAHCPAFRQPPAFAFKNFGFLHRHSARLRIGTLISGISTDVLSRHQPSFGCMMETTTQTRNDMADEVWGFG